MQTSKSNRLLRPETLVALGTIVFACAFLIPTAALSPISALLPVSMLVSMVVLALVMLVADQRQAAKGEAACPMTKAPKRVLGALTLVVVYCLSVDIVGFYPSTALSVPLVAYLFGYRSVRGLGIATVIVLVGIYLVFGVAMSQEFPVGRLWME